VGLLRNTIAIAITVFLIAGCASKDQPPRVPLPRAPQPAIERKASDGRLPGDIQVLIDLLAATSNEAAPEQALAAHKKLVQMSVAAFPALIENRDDARAAWGCFQLSTVNPTTVGEVCACIIQGQVELNVPKLYRDLRLLGHLPSKVKLSQWWEKRSDRTLRDLRIEAAKYSIEATKKAKFTSEKEKQQVLDKFTNRLREVELMLTKRQVEAVYPVMESLARALAKIAPKYPEMSDYREEKALYKLERSIGVRYSHNFTRPNTKRAVRPSDYGENGFRVYFGCAAMPPSSDWKYAMSSPSLTLRNLRLYLWMGVGTAPNPSKGIAEEVGSILRSHMEKLEQIEVTEIFRAKYEHAKIESIAFRKQFSKYKNVWVVRTRISHPKHDTPEGPGQGVVIIIDSGTGEIIRVDKMREK